ncbi:hypothetical protein G5V59_10945 [Nocardioides sp. W3-2-3]|uniref:hypothetical protein n=1 Tax=Nocardioides convexus TaxID=2712224 RepID=UPI0024183980|nr:hypothetical protein [Nocardioides convexus]NHA00414.1 hypothetical protein [Nocardioides convexus]
MSRLLLAIVLLSDLVLHVWCASADGVDVSGPPEAALQPPRRAVRRLAGPRQPRPHRRVPAAALALTAVPLHFVARALVESLAASAWIDATSPLLLLEALLVSPVLVAAWGVALLDGPWRRGILVAPAVVLVQMLLARASAADQDTFGPGLLSWCWRLLPVLAAMAACAAAGGRWAPGTTTARHPRG